MKLLIVIPALNEEQSIESIIRRCLAARELIIGGSSVTDVEITVVSDGSTDRTVQLARQHLPAINLIVFEKNRGYGAAIKEAWKRSDADLLGFIDADGTCDPRFFVDLCRTLDAAAADVVLGSRVHKESRMPLLRRIGNRIFAWMLGTLSASRIRDTASGMQVVRRDSLPRLLPLPDGLHFTPAMTAKALMSNAVRIIAVDMPYAEREGRSKLSIVKDSLRFLRVILEASFLYWPGRPLAILAAACLAAAIALMAMPVDYYVRHHAVPDWMIYRFVVAHLAGTAGVLFLCASHLTTKIVDITLQLPRRPGLAARALESFFRGRAFWLVPALLVLAGGTLVLPSFVQRVETGKIYEHWSRFIAMSFFWSVAFVLVVSRSIDYVLDLLAAQVGYAREHGSDYAPRPASPAERVWRVVPQTDPRTPRQTS